jgi:ribonuclease VapC
VIVVDTSALLAILHKEAERDRFLDILANDDKPMVSAVTFYEAMLVATARRGPGNLDDLDDLVEAAEAAIVLLTRNRPAPPIPPIYATAKASTQLPG